MVKKPRESGGQTGPETKMQPFDLNMGADLMVLQHSNYQ